MSTADLKQRVASRQPGQASPFDVLRMQMLQRRGDLQQLLGNKVDAFIQVTMNAIAHRPELLEADRQSLFVACRQAALDGLYPDGKDAVLNIYNTKVKDKETGRDRWIRKVQYLPMVRGLIRLIWETKQFVMIDAVAVYEKDFFEYRRGDDPSIDHVPYAGQEDPGPVIAAYFVAKTASGERKREVMFRRDIEKARAASKNPDGGPWVDWYDQMAIKTVIHRAYKQLAGPSELNGVIERDQAIAIGDGVFDLGEQAPAIEADSQPARTVVVDTPTPYLMPAGQPKAAQVEPVKGRPAKARPDEPTQPAPSRDPGGPPSYADALSLVSQGDYGAAIDIASALGRAEEIETAIAAIKSGTK